MDDKKNKPDSVEQGSKTGEQQYALVNSADAFFKDRPDFISGTWLQYTVSELGSWVSLFLKRAFHRHDQKKRAKDIFDAGEYLRMISAHVQSAEKNSSDECIEELKRLKSQKA